MLTIVDLVYHSHTGIQDPQQVLDLHRRPLGYVPEMRQVNMNVISHLDFEGEINSGEAKYFFFRRRNASWQVPVRTHKFIRALKPDVVLVHGFIFPLQVITLKAMVPRCKIILQHHADEPRPSVRRIFQKLADRFVEMYLFTSIELAQPWIGQGIIGSKSKCREVLSASTHIRAKDRSTCKKRLCFTGNKNILWVGRLNRNKDPLTVLKAFDAYRAQQPTAFLYMIFQTVELLGILEGYIRKNKLQDHVRLVGAIPAEDIADWYSAADIFVSGSHQESGGYALVEAMHCGCIPVVSDIPSFRKITRGGEFGFLYEAGNVTELLSALNMAGSMQTALFSDRVKDHAARELSYKKIAEDLLAICREVTG